MGFNELFIVRLGKVKLIVLFKNSLVVIFQSRRILVHQKQGNKVNRCVVKQKRIVEDWRNKEGRQTGGVDEERKYFKKVVIVCGKCV